MFISRAPYRLSFYGGGLDYPQWFNKFPSEILCSSLDKYCYLMIRELPPFFNHKIRVAYSKIELCENVEEIKHPSVREVLKYFNIKDGLELTHIGDLPAKSGVGSSSAFTVSLVNAISKMKNIVYSKYDIAKLSTKIEQNLIKENVGIQDQFAASLGGFILLSASKEGITYKKINVSKVYQEYLEANLLIGFSGRSRYSSLKAEKLVKHIYNNEKNDLMNELQRLSARGIKAFLENAEINFHSELTKKIRDIKLELNGDKHDNFINSIIAKTESAGSMCTKFLGAGGGGFFICWAPKEFHSQIKESISIKTWLNVKFSFDGCSVLAKDFPDYVI